jgi:hypothetical protein
MDKNEVLKWLSENVTYCGEISIVGDKINSSDGVLFKRNVLTHIPYPFGVLGGSFDVSNNQLKTLENFPTSINGIVDIRNNPIESLPISFKPYIVEGRYGWEKRGGWDKHHFILKSLIGDILMDYDTFIKIEREIKLKHLL